MGLRVKLTDSNLNIHLKFQRLTRSNTLASERIARCSGVATLSTKGCYFNDPRASKHGFPRQSVGTRA